MIKILSLEVLKLKEFRNFSNSFFEFTPGINIIFGDNGIGKTNILEAISLLIPGKGIKNADLVSLDNFDQDSNFKINWHLNANVKTKFGTKDIETYRSGNSVNDKVQRIVKIDGELIKNKNHLLEFVDITWLTPKICGLFNDTSSERRKFIDRIVSGFRLDHNKLLNKYEYYQKERMKLLKENYSDEHWLSLIEKNLAELAAAISLNRKDIIQEINSKISSLDKNFIKIQIMMKCNVEYFTPNKSLIDVEKEISKILKENREIDRITGRTSFGTHKSDLIAFNLNKNIDATESSTGEQKSMIISILIGEILSKAATQNVIPIVLLDDIIEHLDEIKRDSLLEILNSLRAQVIITGTTKSNFSYLFNKSNFIELSKQKV